MFQDLVAEIVGMFVGDARLTIAVLGIVGLSAVLIRLAGIDPLVGGGVLTFGCLLTLVESVHRSSRRRAPAGTKAQTEV
jgi:hypothetical protein